MLSEEALVQLCSVLSGSVILLSFFSKLSQIYEVLIYESSEGVSLGNFAFEMAALSVITSYSYAMGYLLQTYVENIPVVVQDAVLIVLICHQRSLFVLGAIPYYLLYLLVCVVIAMKLLTDILMMGCVYAALVFLNVSKIMQLKTIMDNESAGRVNALGWGISIYITAVRILTTIVLEMDVPMLISLITNEVLNLAVLASVLHYNSISRRAERRRTS